MNAIRPIYKIPCVTNLRGIANNQPIGSGLSALVYRLWFISLLVINEKTKSSFKSLRTEQAPALQKEF